MNAAALEFDPAFVRKWSRRVAAVAAALLLLGQALFLVRGLDAPESWTSGDAASFVEASRNATLFYDSGWREPLLPFLTRLVAAAGVPDLRALRLVTCAGFWLATLALLLVAWRRSGAWSAVLATGLWGFNSCLLTYAIAGDRSPANAGLLLLYAHLLFDRAPSRGRTLWLGLVGALLPLWRSENLAIVVIAVLLKMLLARRNRREVGALAASLAISLLLFLPYPLVERQRTGLAFYGSAMHARFWANVEFQGPGHPCATRNEALNDPYRGGPLSPAAYIFGMHSFPDVIRRFLAGYGLLLGTYLPIYAVPWIAIYLLSLIGAATHVRARRGGEVLYAVIAHLPYAFIYPLDQVFPGSGVEARFALSTSALLMVWAAEAFHAGAGWLLRRGFAPRPAAA